MTAKTQACSPTVAMKMGQAIYEKEQAAAAAPGADQPGRDGRSGADDDVVDAEFEVDDARSRRQPAEG